MARHEEKLQIAVCNYIRYQYPKLLFTLESSGFNAHKKDAGVRKMQRSGRGFPDLMIFEPKGSEVKYFGLFLELKREGTILYKRDGTLRCNTHIQEQSEMIERLKQKGYYATFAVGFDSAKKIIDDYLHERI